jgi:biopolymer transport protein ExbD/biopolymer transport protein TolR
VKDLLINRLDKTVFVRGDSRARYERVVEVVDNLRAAGVDQLGLLTEQILDTTRPNPSGAAQ